MRRFWKSLFYIIISMQNASRNCLFIRTWTEPFVNDQTKCVLSHAINRVVKDLRGVSKYIMIYDLRV